MQTADLVRAQHMPQQLPPPPSPASLAPSARVRKPGKRPPVGSQDGETEGLHLRPDAGVARYELFGPSLERFGNPAPLGLLGLAIACAALVPIAFGVSVTPAAFASTAIYALLFGAGCQLLSGLMLFANRNGFGGTVFTCFSFLWALNAWSFWGLSQGRIPDHAVALSVELVLFVIFAALTWGFGHLGRALFLFLLDIDLLFAFRIARSLSHSTALELPIAVCTVLLGAIGLWLALGSLLHPILGRQLLPIGAPVFHAPRPPAFDWTLRRALFATLYAHWQEHAFKPLSLGDLRARMPGDQDVAPDLFYLAELGYVVLELSESDPHDIVAVRLHASGVDIHEQLALGKYNAAAPAH